MKTILVYCQISVLRSYVLEAVEEGIHMCFQTEETAILSCAKYEFKTFKTA